MKSNEPKGVTVVQCNGEGWIEMCGEKIDLPYGAKNVKVRGDKIYVDGKEYVDGEWRRTIPSSLSIFF